MARRSWYPSRMDNAHELQAIIMKAARLQAAAIVVSGSASYGSLEDLARLKGAAMKLLLDELTP
jgi:hypothetical protein